MRTLNSLQSTLKIEKEKEQGEALRAQGLDDISHLQNVLSTWENEGQEWTFTEELHELVAQACPAGAQIAKCAWIFLRENRLWHHMV